MPWQPPPAGPGEIVYKGLGIRTSAAPAGVVPSIAKQTALASPAVTEFTARGLAVGEPDVQLRLITDDRSPADHTPPEHVNQPAWVLTFHGSPPDYKGKIGFTPAAQQPKCDFVIAIDSATGAEVLIAQVCPGT